MTGMKDINDLMVGLLGVPKKYKQKYGQYKGFYPLIKKWMKDFPVDFIYQVVSALVLEASRDNKKVGVGLISYELKRRFPSYVYAEQNTADELPEEASVRPDVNADDIRKVKELFGAAE